MSRATKQVIESTGRRILEQSRIRLLCIGFFFVLCFGSISVRMFDVAVLHRHQAMTITVSDPDNEEKSEQVELKSLEPVLQRGDIVDRNGVLLATSLMTASVFANPNEIGNLDEAAKRLEKIVGIDGNVLLKRLKGGKSFVWIKRNLTPKEESQVNALGIPGLYFLPEEKRIYPYANLLSHVIGYVGIDNKGLEGIEKQFDARLRDPNVNQQGFPLSLDVRLQAITHEEVKKAMDEFRAIGAAGIIMDIHSGEILSMVSLPDFDPNHPAKADDAAKFNRASLGAYEMGSTFKSFTMAMGMEYGVATMKSGYDATNPFKIAGFTITDDHPKRRFLTVPEIYAYSSNIGTAKMVLDVGVKRQKAFLSRLGMMQPVDIELPERAQPQYPAEWKEISSVTIAYGHGMSVSPLHLVRGIATLVGGGTLPKLTLVKDSNKDRPEGERIISEDVSKNMRRLLRLVVDHGTGSKADVPGYRVGGKTGTAEEIGSNGKYEKHANLSSFIAAFPIDDPKYIVLVMLDDPKGTKETYGFVTAGWVAAPAAGRIIARMGPMLGLRPAYDVAADDAEKFWTDNDKPKVQSMAAPGWQKKYLHAAAY